MIVVKVTENKVDENYEKIKMCSEIIKRGGLVAFPTETVYGLGCNGLNANAVKKLFKVKGRPAKNPLILHVYSMKQIEEVAEVNETAVKLIKKFFPGPLTLILKKKNIVPSITSAGMDKIAVRMPSNKIALKLIEFSETAIAAPSANKSGGISPTNAEHVMREFRDEIDAIIDGGNTKIGIESTVLDLTTQPPKILRIGAVTIEMLREVGVEPVLEIFRTHRHYKTKAKIVIAKKNEIYDTAISLANKGFKVGVCFTEFLNESKNTKIIDEEMKTRFKRLNNLNNQKIYLVKLGDSLDEAAKNLFGTIKELEDKVDIIIFQEIEEKGVGLAIMDRIKEASKN